MKKNIFTIIIFFAGIGYTFAQFAGGDGTKLNPYQISTPEHLNNVRNYLSSYFIQINNIDLRGYDHDNDGKGWMPIGGAGTNKTFYGNYDGQSYTINNIYINRPETNDIGLFGKVGTDRSGTEVSVTNIGLNNFDITGNNGVGSLTGGLVSNKKTIIEYAYANGGIVKANGNLGGLIGYARSYQTSAGTKERPTISKVFSSTKVVWAQQKSGNNFGGLIGSALSININNTYSRSSITIDNSTVNLSSLEDVGGLIGHADNKTTVKFSYSTGSVIAIGTPPVNHVGGLMGFATGNVSISDSYWDTETSGLNNSDGGNGMTTEELQDQSVFTNFDFDNIWDIDNNINDGYPYLIGGNNNVLPINMEYFNVRSADNTVELEWATATEINNDFFSVERSIDGINFETIATIEGAGNSSTTNEYFITDLNPINGYNYYRIKQTDFNGDFEIFQIKSINIEISSEDLQIYPNPNKGEFKVSVSSNNQTYYSIFDYSGKVVRDGYFNSFENKINISNLSAGVYFLKTGSKTHKIIKK